MDIRNEVEYIEKNGLGGATATVINIQREMQDLAKKLHFFKMLALIKTIEDNLATNSFKKGSIDSISISFQENAEENLELSISLHMTTGELLRAWDTNATRARLYQEVVDDYEKTPIVKENVNITEGYRKSFKFNETITEELLDFLVSPEMKNTYQVTRQNYQLNISLPQKTETTKKIKI